MEKLFLAAALAAAILVPALPAAAADTTTMSGPMMCRAAKTGETPNATMGSAGMMCRTVDMDKVKANMAKMQAAMTKMQAGAMTPDQKAAAGDLSAGMESMNTLYGFGGG